ncbi:MAG: T9SS type A sorting domain-containing protein [Lewinellaceae bacterium]|nr:T9SS type A sorting domain-containing protein [Lewinellaceae bacterium]
MRARFPLFLILFFCPLFASAQMSFEVNDDFPLEYPAKIFDPRVAQVHTAVFNGEPLQYTLFEDGQNLFPFEKGILLTTGKYTNVAQSGSDLDHAYLKIFNNSPEVYMLNPGDIPWDAGKLTVVFTPLVDTLRFRFAFATEEYPLYTCASYNDLMGIFLSKTGQPPVNIAKTASGQNIGVNTVFCQGQKPFSHSDFWMGFNGISDTFDIKIPVDPCTEYTMTIMITDVRDARFDSALFLETIGSPRLNTVFGPSDHVYLEGCATKELDFYFNWLPLFQPIAYEFSGTATPGVDYTLNIPPSGYVSGNAIAFQPTIIADSIADEGEYFLFTYRSLNPGCQLRGGRIFYIAEIDSTAEVICKEQPVPAFLPQPTVQFPFDNPTPYSMSPDFVQSPVYTQDFPYEFFTSPYMIEDVCVDMTVPAANARLYLQASNMSRVELTTNNGTGGYFTNTCFSPEAIQNIGFSGSPYTGQYRSEGSWFDLYGAPVNGEWNLLAKTGSGSLHNWHMTLTKNFLYHEFDYLWPDGSTQAAPLFSPPPADTVLQVLLENDLMTMTVPVRLIPKTPVQVQKKLTLCLGDSFTIQGQTFDQFNPVGIVEIGDCDTVMLVQITFVPDFQTFFRDTLCAGASLFGNGTEYNQQNPQGLEVFQPASMLCDSFVFVSLVFLPPIQKTHRPIICVGGSIEINGIVYDAQNPTGTQTLTAADGCDSVVHIILHFLPEIVHPFDPTLCAGESVVVNGTEYDAQNPVGTEILTAANGCDSTVKIALQFFPAIENTFGPTLCAGESVVVNGTEYDAQNPVGTEILTAANGCDSTVQIALQFLPAIENTFSPTLCAGESVVVNGTEYDAQNPVGTEILTAANGCDSTVQVALQFFPPIENTFGPTLCAGESVVVNGTEYDAQNPVGTEILTAANGCDSTVQIALQFFPPIENTFGPTLCAGESVVVNGTEYDAQNPVGTEILTAANGCDSTVQIALQFFPAIENTFSPTLCAGESVVVNGTEYNAQNPVGTEILTAANGCDSAVQVALQFFPPIENTFGPTLCAGESVVVNGTEYNAQNPVGTEIFTAENGCDSTVQIQLAFWPVDAGGLLYELCPGENLTVNGTLYDEQHPGGTEIYAYANGCDSFYLYVQLMYLPEYRDTLVATIQPGETYTVGNFPFTEPGTYTIDLTASNSCDSTIVLVLDVTLGGSEALLPGSSFRIFPNPATDRVNIELLGAGQLQAVRIFDLTGRLVDAPVVGNSTLFRLDVSGFPAGVYSVGVQVDGRWGFVKMVRMR